MSEAIQGPVLSELPGSITQEFLDKHGLIQIKKTNALRATRPTTEALYGVLTRTMEKWTSIEDCAAVLYGTRVEKNVSAMRSRVRASRKILLDQNPGALLLVKYSGSFPGKKSLGRIEALKLFNPDSSEDKGFVAGYISCIEERNECTLAQIERMRKMAGLEVDGDDDIQR
jgi:hypothetical protein